MKFIKLLKENSIYPSGQTNVIKDNVELGDIFWINYLGFSGLHNTDNKNAKLEHYLKADRVQLDKITDQNGDLSLCIKLLVDAKIIPDSKAHILTKFLALLKQGKIDKIDENLLRGQANLTTTIIKCDGPIKALVDDFLSGKMTLTQIIKPLFTFAKRKKICTEFINIAKHMIAKIDDDDVVPTATAPAIVASTATVPKPAFKQSIVNAPTPPTQIATVPTTWQEACKNLSTVTTPDDVIFMFLRIWNLDKKSISKEWRMFDITKMNEPDHLSNVFTKYYLDMFDNSPESYPLASKLVPGDIFNSNAFFTKFNLENIRTFLDRRALQFFYDNFVEYGLEANDYESIKDCIKRKDVRGNFYLSNNKQLFNRFTKYMADITDITEFKNHWEALKFMPLGPGLLSAINPKKNLSETIFSKMFNTHFKPNCLQVIEILQYLDIESPNLLKSYYYNKSLDIEIRKKFAAAGLLGQPGYEKNITGTEVPGLIIINTEQAKEIYIKEINPSANLNFSDVVKMNVDEYNKLGMYEFIKKYHKGYEEFFRRQIQNDDSITIKKIINEKLVPIDVLIAAINDKSSSVLNRFLNFPSEVVKIILAIPGLKEILKERFIKDGEHLSTSNWYSSGEQEIIKKFIVFNKAEYIKFLRSDFYTNRPYIFLTLKYTLNLQEIFGWTITIHDILSPEFLKDIPQNQISGIYDLLEDHDKIDNYPFFDNENCIKIFDHIINQYITNQTFESLKKTKAEDIYLLPSAYRYITDVLNFLQRFGSDTKFLDGVYEDIIPDHVSFTMYNKDSEKFNALEQNKKAAENILAKYQDVLKNKTVNDHLKTQYHGFIRSSMYTNFWKNIDKDLKEPFLNLVIDCNTYFNSNQYGITSDIYEKTDDYSIDTKLKWLKYEAKRLSDAKNKDVTSVVEGNMQELLFDIFDSPMQAELNDVIESFGKRADCVFNLLKNASSIQPVLERIMHSKALIKPEVNNFTHDQLKKCLALNNFTLQETKMRKIKGEKYVDYLKRLQKEIEYMDTSQLEAKVTESTDNTETLEKKSAELYRYYTTNRAHGNVGCKIIKSYDVNLRFSEFETFKAQYPDTKVIPSFHGTGTVAASMILRFGFKIISSSEANKAGLNKAGEMLGSGVYLGGFVDKSCGYIRDGGNWSNKHGQIGYLLECETYIGQNNVHHRKAGSGGDSIKSIEYVVQDPRSQIKIVKAHKVEVCSRDLIESWYKKHYPNGVNESNTEFPLMFKSFKKYLKEDNKMFRNNVVQFKFSENSIPISKTETVSFQEFCKKYCDDGVRASETQTGFSIEIDVDIDTYFNVDVIETDHWMATDPEGTFSQYIHFLEQKI